MGRFHSEFGEGHSVEMTIRRDATKRTSLSQQTPGPTEIQCDGKIVHRVEGRPNTTAGPLFLHIGLIRGSGAPDCSPEEALEARFRKFRIEQR